MVDFLFSAFLCSIAFDLPVIDSSVSSRILPFIGASPIMLGSPS